MSEKIEPSSRERARSTRQVINFIRHQPDEAFLLLRMATWVGLLSLLIKFYPLPRVLAFVAVPRHLLATTPGRVAQERLAQLLDLLLALDILCFTPTCWKRAPVLHRYLALSGIETRIVFGVRLEGDSMLVGHAWLEAGGLPIFETSAPHYTVTYSYPA